MGRYLIRRLFHSIFVTAGVLIVVFLVGHGLGDPAKLMLPVEATDEQIRAVRTSLGLDDPLYVQFARFAAGVVRGDFGNSMYQHLPALPIVIARIPATLFLTAVTMLLAVPAAVALGVLAATRPRSLVDRLVTVFSLASVSIAGFWLGLMLILLVAVGLGWLPSSGYGEPRHVILPALTLCFHPFGRIAQVTRSSMLDELSRAYVVTARSKGLREWVVINYHTLKNAALPVITLTGNEMASLLNGAVVVETVFAWPGVGILLIQAIERRDLPLIEADVFVIALMIMTLNLIVDLTYAFFNPRIRYE